MQVRLINLFHASRVLMPVLLGCLLSLAGAPRLRASGDDCRRNVAKADHHLHEAIEHHGYYSKQAIHRRHGLEEARERCWAHYQRWWDEDGQRWHSDHDWYDHDHGRDIDHR